MAKRRDPTAGCRWKAVFSAATNLFPLKTVVCKCPTCRFASLTPPARGLAFRPRAHPAQPF